MNWRHERWVKLYKRVEGSFASLPLFTRGIADELLRLCDSHGRIGLRPGEDLWQAVAMRAGARREERKMLRRCIEELFADGFIVQAGATVTIRNFCAAQGVAEPELKAPPPAQDRRQPEPSPVLHGVFTDASPVLHGEFPECLGEPKYAIQAENAPLEEKRKEEKREEERGRPPALPVRASRSVLPVDAPSLLQALRVAVEREQPQLGFWQPGSFGVKEAQEIFDLLPEGERQARAPWLLEQVEAFARQPPDGVRSVKAFRKFLDGAGARASPQAAKQQRSAEALARALDRL